MKTASRPPIDQTAVCGHKNPQAVRELLTRIGDKWSILLLLSLLLLGGRARFSVLERAIPGISQRMLSLTLRNLERDGMLSREVFPEVPPRVEYEITDLGRSLAAQMKSLSEWMAANWDRIEAAHADFDAR